MALSCERAMQVFFIVGAQKSGTTWLQKSLTALKASTALVKGISSTSC